MVTPPEQQPPTSSVVVKTPDDRVHRAPGRSPIDEAPGLDSPSPSQAEMDTNLPKWGFTIPKSARDPKRDPMKIVLRELTPDQMELAARLATGGGGAKPSRKQSLEANIKMALWEVDGRRVNHGDAEDEAYWARWSPKVRTLIYQGYARIHLSTDEEDAAFLGSMTPA